MESYFWGFLQLKAPKTRFPLNPSHDRRGGNRIFQVLGSQEHQKHDSRSPVPRPKRAGIAFLRFSAAKNTKNMIPAQPAPRQEKRESYFWGCGQLKTPKTRFPLNPTTGEEGIVFWRFSAAKNTKNTIPAQPVPHDRRGGNRILRFSAAKTTKNTIPAQPVPRQERRESYFWGCGMLWAAKDTKNTIPAQPAESNFWGFRQLKTLKHDSRSTRPATRRGGNRIWGFRQLKTPKTRFPLNPSHDQRGGNRIFEVFGRKAPKTRFPLNPSHDRRGGNRIFEVLESCFRFRPCWWLNGASVMVLWMFALPASTVQFYLSWMKLRRELVGLRSLSPLNPRMTRDLHVSTATSLHQSFPWLELLSAHALTQASLNWLVGCWCKKPSSHLHRESPSSCAKVWHLRIRRITRIIYY